MRRPRLALRKRAAFGLGAALALLAACAPAPRPPALPPPVAPPVVPAPAPEAEDTLIGPTGGRLVVDAMEYPWSALGRLNAGGRAFCTGVLIGPRHVLTTARCVYNAVEGRWWTAREMHFVAGYQRDHVLIDAPVARVTAAPEFRPGGATTLGGVQTDWALLELVRPIGEEAGWLGVQWLVADAVAGIDRGEGYLLEAGYRSQFAHAVTANVGCIRRGQSCAGGADFVGLTTLAFVGGEMRVVPSQLRRPSLAALAAGDSLYAALEAAGLNGNGGRGPRARSAAAAVPVKAIDHLLRTLGYWQGRDGTVEARRAAAIRAFEHEAGLPPTGVATVATLGHLIDALTRQPRLLTLNGHARPSR
jgi:hypothetical protein